MSKSNRRVEELSILGTTEQPELNANTALQLIEGTLKIFRTTEQATNYPVPWILASAHRDTVTENQL